MFYSTTLLCYRRLYAYAVWYRRYQVPWYHVQAGTSKYKYHGTSW